jgi:hypothetical protein
MLSCLTGEHFYYSICIALSARSFSDAATFSDHQKGGTVKIVPPRKALIHAHVAKRAGSILD